MTPTDTTADECRRCRRQLATLSESERDILRAKLPPSENWRINDHR